MSEEERAAVLETMQASGGKFGGGAGSGGGLDQVGTGILLNPLIELLTQRAVE